ncbi:2-polyprenyl-3-methyl-6-methoxy-1,4-benzoquinone monooxygenase [Ketobacter sp.]|uniref:2-polyprenyl-3-methyl-6-methoxy-1,4-benzoquinone monooxygenase n=1 Tax=Ketobacter sp. TaxID=2083498 RepID=UPI000F2737D6|nr:2-polyprenyl-3-methyl-6-methoxy-1,4-benzoquinone monooxygenase [Ketobacter sp.]RLT92263.1 MAG: 2-polyprenyl-3-methyl-6-methoxy-1,4-benzoquinone monooxygenase [Ketobacter sp.]
MGTHPQRRYSLFDRLIGQADNALRTVAGGHPGTQRPNPTAGTEIPPLAPAERRHVAGLMRVNHTGEVCAQALYQGQAVTARLPRIRRQMEVSAQEEEDHLHWCEQRLQELGSHTSLLNPVWYSLSFGIGAVAGAIGDRWSLGFVEETEKQVCRHLESHMAQLPPQDQRSLRILEQMHTDEAQHATTAHKAGAMDLPFPVKKLMQAVAKVMTETAYRV